jgi:hypothetical protein
MTYLKNALNAYSLRSPKRITITVPHSTFEKMVGRSNEQGRSLSNLAAFILEQGLKD